MPMFEKRPLLESFMADLHALLDRYGVEGFGACSCCNGLNIDLPDGTAVTDVVFDARELRWRDTDNVRSTIKAAE